MAGRKQRRDDDDGPIASTSSLAAISQPVVVYKAKRRPNRDDDEDDDDRLAPLCAFPAISPYEAAHSDVPRRLRRRAYLKAKQTLASLCDEALDDVAAPTVERLEAWLDDAGRSTRRGTRTIPLAAVQSLLPQSGIFQRTLTQLSSGARGKGKAAAATNSNHTAWAHLSLTHCQASSAARLVEVIVEQWLAQFAQAKDTATTGSGGGSGGGSGATSAWRALQTRHRHLPPSSRPQTYVVTLAGLPQAPLFSTLAYLANLPALDDTANADGQLNVAIVLQCCQGLAGLDGVPWEDKRGLDVDVLQMGTVGWDARKLISRIATTPGLGPRHENGSGGALSPAMLRAAYQRAKENTSSPSAAIEAVRGWLDLALQRHFTASLCSLGSPLLSSSSLSSSSSSSLPDLSPSDFTPAFFMQLRSSLVRSLTLTPPSSSSDESEDDEMDLDTKPPKRRRRKGHRGAGADEPNLACLPDWLRDDRRKLRAVMKGEDDATLLQLWLSSLAESAGGNNDGEQGRDQAQAQEALGLELLALGMPQSSTSTAASTTPTDARDLDALRYALATSAAPSSTFSGGDEEDEEDGEYAAASRTAAVELRRKVNAILAPRLKALRRPAVADEMASSPSTSKTSGSEGSMAALEAWLDKVEDWADASPSANALDASSTIKSDLLLRIRALQQELAACLADSSTSTAASAAPPLASSSTAPRSPDVAAVSRRLLLEERVRSLRSSLADWYGSTVRRLLLASSTAPALRRRRRLFSDVFVDGSGGLQAVASLEAMAAGGACPRAAVTLGLARPGVYLEHFAVAAAAAAAEEAEGQEENDGTNEKEIRERLQRLRAMLGHTDGHQQKREQDPPTTPSKKRKRGGGAAAEPLVSMDSTTSSRHEASTDLSTAYSLLLEAGGPGGGTRGRLVNIDDWYRAWLAVLVRGGSRDDASKKKKQDKGEAEADPQARFALALSTLALLGYVKKTTRGDGAGGGGRTKAEGRGRGGGGGGQRGATGVRVAKVGGWDRVLGLREEEEADMLGGGAGGEGEEEEGDA